MYIIYEIYDVDGGFGDAISREKVIGAVKTESEAQAYVDRYSCAHIYDAPYAELEQGRLGYRKITELNINKDIDLWIKTAKHWLNQISCGRGFNASVKKVEDYLAKLKSIKAGVKK